MDFTATIVALSSAAGPSARGVVRVAGPQAFALLRHIGVPDTPAASTATRVTLAFDGLTVPAWLFVFAAPRSYTGDDTIELHLPGSPLLARMLIDTLTAAGATPAGPGEFTARALLNGRLDLAEAEAVGLIVAAEHAAELDAARRMRAGELSRRTDPVLDAVADTLALLESNLDFADEGIAFVDAAEVCRRSSAAQATLAGLLARADRYESLTRPPTVALVGLPNAGKSTLLNALAGHARAVVSPVAGTTRDVLAADVRLPRGTVTLLDLAGLEPASADTGPTAAVARQMQEQARRALDEADVVIEVRASDEPAAAWLPRPASLVVWTKADLAARRGTGFQPVSLSAREEHGLKTRATASADEPPRTLRVSALTGEGLNHLRHAIDAAAFAGTPADRVTLTGRQADAVARAVAALARVPDAVAVGPEFAAAELRAALDALGDVRGVVTPDDVLGRVFAGFCIGK